MGKFSDTRRHKSWNGPYVQAQVETGENPGAGNAPDIPPVSEEIAAARLLVFTAPVGEGTVIPRVFSNYEKKLKFNPGIMSDLYENISAALPDGNHNLPDEDEMEIITSRNWHPDFFSPGAGKDDVKADVMRYMADHEPAAIIIRTLMLRIETEHCLAFCVMLAA